LFVYRNTEKNKKNKNSSAYCADHDPISGTSHAPGSPEFGGRGYLTRDTDVTIRVEAEPGGQYLVSVSSPRHYPFLTFDEKRDNRFDGGFLAGFGVQFDLKAFGVFVECRYNYSFSDLQKQYQEHGFTPQKNGTWSIQAGILINPGLFGGKK
jgi:hypothetical protein